MSLDLTTQKYIVGTTEAVEASDMISLAVPRGNDAPFRLSSGDKIEVIVTPDGGPPETLATGTVPASPSTTWDVLVQLMITQTPPVEKAPVVLSVGPEEGSPSTLITIFGENLPADVDAEVKIGTTVCTAVDTGDWSSLQIYVECPAGIAVGTYAVSVKDTSSGLTSNTDQTFEILAPDILNSGGLDPLSAPVGDVISIYGDEFSENVSDNAVTFASAAPVEPLTAQKDTLTVRVPKDAVTGTLDVEVNPNFTSSTETFTRLDHTVTSYSPNNAAVGALVTINGTNFSSQVLDHDVEFFSGAAVDSSATSRLSSTQLQVRVPKTVSETPGPITVSIGPVDVDGPNFTRNNHTITSYSPTHAAPLAAVDVNGTNFSTVTGDAEVYFTKSGGGWTAASVTLGSSSSTNLRVTVPSDADTGAVKVKIGSVEVVGGSFTVD